MTTVKGGKVEKSGVSGGKRQGVRNLMGRIIEMVLVRVVE